MKTRQQALAFTLVEVLVALVIFAVLAVIGYRTLSSIFDARERLSQQSSVLRDQALFFTRLEADLGALLPRKTRNADGVSEPELMVLSAAVSAVDPVIVFTRTGFAGASGANAAPQRIGYRLNDGKIELLVWDGIDAAPRALPNTYSALANVREFRWRVLDRSGNWRADWPIRTGVPSATAASVVSSPFPAALELTLVQGDAAPIVRLFALREVIGG
jgi:general secretion pathway protein J